MINLRQQPDYSFSFGAQDEERFLLHFNYNTTKLFSKEVSSIQIYTYGRSIYLNNPFNTSCSVSICDLLGREFKTQKVGTGISVVNNGNNAAGIYLVKVMSEKGIFFQKVMME